MKSSLPHKGERNELLEKFASAIIDLVFVCALSRSARKLALDGGLRAR